MAVAKNQHIELTVNRIEQDQSGYWSVYFNRPQNFTFEAGDWIDIQFEGHTLKGGITYSISSSPLEDDIRIIFREGISEFKKALQSAKAGERLYISQYGNDYGFQLKKINRACLLQAVSALHHFEVYSQRCTRIMQKMRYLSFT